MLKIKFNYRLKDYLNLNCTMPNLPPFFNGKISGVLTISILNIHWYKNDVKSSYIQFEWTGSQEKHKLL